MTAPPGDGLRIPRRHGRAGGLVPHPPACPLRRYTPQPRQVPPGSDRRTASPSGRLKFFSPNGPWFSPPSPDQRLLQRSCMRQRRGQDFASLNDVVRASIGRIPHGFGPSALRYSERVLTILRVGWPSRTWPSVEELLKRASRLCDRRPQIGAYRCRAALARSALSPMPDRYFSRQHSPPSDEHN